MLRTSSSCSRQRIGTRSSTRRASSAGRCSTRGGSRPSAGCSTFSPPERRRVDAAALTVGSPEPECRCEGRDVLRRDAHRVPRVTVDIGRIGIWTAAFEAHPSAAAKEAAQEIEALGYSTLWLNETPGRDPFLMSALLLSAPSTLKLA